MAQHHVTQVGKHVDKHAAKLAAGIHATLQLWARKLAKRATQGMAKTDMDEVKKILARMRLEGFSVDLVDELTPAMLEAFRLGGAYGVLQTHIDMTDDMTKQLDVEAKAYAEKRGVELVKDFEDTTMDSLRSTVARGVTEGMSPSALADAIQESGAFSDSRAMMIARTELAFAHVQGNVQGWRDTGEVEGKRAILGDLHDHEDECDECSDAGVVPLDDDFIPGYSFPPFHPNACLEGSSFAAYGELQQLVRARYCGPATLLIAEVPRELVEKLSRNTKLPPRFYDAAAINQILESQPELVDTDRLSGDTTVGSKWICLTIGPNHPILTARGFMAAQLLTEGDQVLYDTSADFSFASAGKANLQQVMFFEDAFSTLAARFGQTTIAAAASYFHGDEAFIYGEVDVIRPKRNLLLEAESFGAEQISKDFLMWPNSSTADKSTSSTSSFDSIRIDLPSTRGVGASDLFLTLNGCQTGPVRFHSLRIIAAHRVSFEGYAFDASTSTGLYSNSGLVVKNCVCDISPVLKPLEGEANDTEQED